MRKGLLLKAGNRKLMYFADFIDECESTRHNNNNCMLPPSQVSFGKN